MGKILALWDFAWYVTRLRMMWRKFYLALRSRESLRSIVFPFYRNSQRIEAFKEELAFWDVELSLKGQYAEFIKKGLTRRLERRNFLQRFLTKLSHYWSSVLGQPGPLIALR